MLLNVVIASILAIIEWVILLKWFKRKIPFLDKVVLKILLIQKQDIDLTMIVLILVGQTARTVTDLRPAGIITLDNERIDAVSDGAFILRNKEVKILEVEGSRVVVREIENT